MDNHLQELNLKIAEAENQKNTQFFTNLLSAKLLFQRASGGVVGKEQFLRDLQDQNIPKLRRYTEDIRVMQISEVENQALVTLVIRTIDEKSVEKRYQNIRLFTRDEAGWVLAFWYNYEITPP